jgi:hypothetical protein
VNTNGFMVGDDELFTAQADTVDLMRLVGADGWPKRPLYTSRARALVHAFTQGRGYDEHDVALVMPVLMALLHEEAAAHPTNWKRVFPPPLGAIPAISATADVEAGRKAGRDALEDVGGMLTDLDEATRQFVEWLEQSATAKKLLEEHLSAAEDALTLHAQKAQGETDVTSPPHGTLLPNTLGLPSLASKDLPRIEMTPPVELDTLEIDL